MRQILFSFLLAASCMTASAQQKFMLPNANPQAKDTERQIEQYGGISILDVVTPSVEVFLPEASKANGTAVILCPGGGLRALSWTSDVIEMAKLLNDNGYAAIGLKYHLNSGSMPKDIKFPPMVDVTGFANFKDGDCNPAHYPHGDSILALAADDANADKIQAVAETLSADMTAIASDTIKFYNGIDGLYVDLVNLINKLFLI